jgi:hypothetical protein
MGGFSKIRLGSKAISFLQKAQGSRSLENLAMPGKISISSVQRVFGGETVFRKTVQALMNSLGVSLPLDELFAMDSSDELFAMDSSDELFAMDSSDELFAMDSSEVESLKKEKPALELQAYLEQLCREMLVPSQELTTNPLTRPGGSLKLEDIYVERGLQQLQLQPKCNSDFSTQPIQVLAGEGDEITQLTHQEFFDRVLELGQSPTSEDRLAITGEVGVGKTTFLQKIASKILENHLGFPIWIRLAQLRDRPLGQYLLTVWLPTVNTNINSEQLEGYLKQQCLEGKVWLLLDELDKMPQPSRRVLIDSMEQGWVKGARMIITSRTEVWQIAQKGLPHFSVYRPIEFSASQLRQFISNWFKKVGSSEHGEALLRRLENPRSEPIRDLSKNPLCCSLLCYAYGTGRGELPPTKAELYSDYVDNLYEWQQWKPEHPAETKPTKRELRQALGELARRALEEGLTILKQDFIENHFAELDEPLFKLALQLNLIILLGIDPEQPRKNLYAFFHSTFQEYFAAGAIADDWHFFLNPVPGNPAAGSYRLFDESKWLNAYLFWLGQPAVPSEAKVSLLRALVAFEDECTDYNFYRLRGYFIAAKGLPEFKDCPPSLADEIVGTIVKLSLGIFEAEHQPLIRTHRSIAASARRALLWSDANRAVDLIVHNLSLIVEKEDLQALKNLISFSGSLFFLFPALRVLWQQLPGDINILQTLIELLLDNRGNTNTLDLDITSTYGSFRRRIADFLKSQVFTEQLPVIINTIKSYKSSQNEANVILYENFGSDIIWHYTQKLPYDKFYQACRGE